MLAVSDHTAANVTIVDPAGAKVLAPGCAAGQSGRRGLVGRRQSRIRGRVRCGQRGRGRSPGRNRAAPPAYRAAARRPGAGRREGPAAGRRFGHRRRDGAGPPQRPAEGPPAGGARALFPGRHPQRSHRGGGQPPAPGRRPPAHAVGGRQPDRPGQACRGRRDQTAAGLDRRPPDRRFARGPLGLRGPHPGPLHAAHHATGARLDEHQRRDDPRPCREEGVLHAAPGPDERRRGGPLGPGDYQGRLDAVRDHRRLPSDCAAGPGEAAPAPAERGVHCRERSGGSAGAD